MHSIKDIDFTDKRVFVRVDFNVPLNAQLEVSDFARIDAAIPTIEYLKSKGAKIVLASHLGRPDAKVDLKYSLRPVAAALASRLGHPVAFMDETIGDRVKKATEVMAKGAIMLLENLRFHTGEESNDPQFAQELANLADVYINDAFGTAHRAHASTYGLPMLMQIKAPGFLMEKELEFLSTKLDNPERPYTVILGGAKVSDKIQVIDRLLEKADKMLIGGAMAYTFALALGKEIGESLAEPDKVPLALELMEKAKKLNVKFILPVDNLVTGKLDFKNRQLGNKQTLSGNFPADWQGVDIGPETIALYSKEIQDSKTILWNGPMGVFEIADSAKGTYEIAKAVAQSEALSVVGGGDSLKAIKGSGCADKITFLSTGGGASLALLEGAELPGVKALECESVEIKG